MIPLSRSARYSKFVGQRDAALDSILDKYLDQVDVMMRLLRQRVDEVVSHQYAEGLAYWHAKQTLEDFKRKMKPWFELMGEQLYWLFCRLRITSYVISHMGEAEAIARATGKKDAKVHVDKAVIESILSTDTPSGGDLRRRIDYALDKLRADIEQAYQLSQVQDDKVQDALERIARAFPAYTTMKQPKRVLQKMREADTDRIKMLNLGKIGQTGFMDQEAINDAVDDYLFDYIDIDRSPAAKVIAINTDEDMVDEMVDSEGIKQRYSWELEREMSGDFVRQVRDGEQDAADQNGVTDLMWLAIIDNKTCDDCCDGSGCSDRDGLTSAQIEDKFGEPITPPAHFNCRCRSVPVTEELPSEEGPDFEDFHDWLSSKG